jgi:putative membrane protein
VPEHRQGRPQDLTGENTMRRTTLAAVAALIAVPALAQTSQLQQTQNQPGASVRTGGAAAGSMMPGDQRSGGMNAGDTQAGAGSGATGSMGGAMQTAQGSMHGAMHQMGQMEMDHARKVLTLGMVALESSKLAQQKAQNPELKEFARFETQEQQTVSEVIHSMLDPTSTASTGAGGAGSTTGSASSAASQRSTAPSMNITLEPKQQATMQKLQSASGADFDRAYIEAQIEGHRELLQAQQQYLQSGKNREHVNVAKLAVNQIQEHLALLEDMQKSGGQKR